MVVGHKFHSYVSLIFHTQINKKCFILIILIFFSVHKNICAQKSLKRTCPASDPVTPLSTLDESDSHCIKRVQIRSFFCSVFSRIWTEYSVQYSYYLDSIRSKYGEIRTRKTPSWRKYYYFTEQ